jgi:tetratricopeptide (TPR) repeat protein
LQAPVPSPAQTAAGVAMGLVLSGVGYWLVKRRWPDAPVWLLPAFFVAAHIIATVTGSLKKRKPLPSDPIGPGGPPRYDWAKSLTAILGGLAVIVLLYGGSIARHFHIRWLAAIPGIAFLFGGRFLFQCYDGLRGYLVEREIKRCRYGKALEMLDGPLGWPSTALWKLMRTDALFCSGGVAEAETILRGLVETEHSAVHKTLAFEHLGRVLLAQGRYDDAKRAFEAVTKLMPGRSAAYAGLAEVRLMQGVEPVQALRDAERALELHRDSLAERKGARERLAIIRGNQAWALARLGRSAESQRAIEAGAREMASNYTPEIAGFYWRAGMAMLAMENATAAVGHFRRAAELDPEGYYGRLAARHLSQHSVWGAVGVAGSRG